MLHHLNHRLTTVAESLAEFTGMITPYLTAGVCTCTTHQNRVEFEYQHDLSFEQAAEQGERLLSLFCFPLSSDSAQQVNLLVDIAGQEHTTRLHFDLTTPQGSDLLLRYVCEELLAYFQQQAAENKQH
ncbi:MULTISPECIES: hypothetical protein [Vibrio]|uniref:Uncharacterized protein n=1 Tax=Vibrio ostreae TaxID=2841925 RepID=A0A975U6K4_9VIBR|nr:MULTISPECIES: hypothetical protein [Vibrio]QXO16073.1 hypothetical protein KNV97_00635 [Vibrio ostreae]WGY44843.1 hypothetical protein J0X00_03795 [Vibrio sp. ABG19]